MEDLSHGSLNVASLGPPEEPLVEELAPAETEEIGARGIAVAEGESLAALVPPEEPALADQGAGSESTLTFKSATQPPRVGLTWPLVAPLTSLFGPAHPLGIDFAADQGTAVRAAGDGRVRAAAYNEIYGNFVILDHPGGYTTVYAHFAIPAPVRSGQGVARGDVIGIVGDTGKSFGPHLHFEVHLNNRLIDPLSALPRIPLVISPLAYRVPAPATLPLEATPAPSATLPPVATTVAPSTSPAAPPQSETPPRPAQAPEPVAATPVRVPPTPPIAGASPEPAITAAPTVVPAAAHPPRAVAGSTPATTPSPSAPPTPRPTPPPATATMPPSPRTVATPPPPSPTPTGAGGGELPGR